MPSSSPISSGDQKSGASRAAGKRRRCRERGTRAEFMARGGAEGERRPRAPVRRSAGRRGRRWRSPGSSTGISLPERTVSLPPRSFAATRPHPRPPGAIRPGARVGGRRRPRRRAKTRGRRQQFQPAPRRSRSRRRCRRRRGARGGRRARETREEADEDDDARRAPRGRHTTATRMTRRATRRRSTRGDADDMRVARARGEGRDPRREARSAARDALWKAYPSDRIVSSAAPIVSARAPNGAGRTPLTSACAPTCVHQSDEESHISDT